LEPIIVECVVETRTFGELLARHGIQEIHLLHIDTEGYDYEILKTVFAVLLRRGAR
jgi:FkbM family methyltransferase